MEKLQRWLEEQCEANNWSWREASIKAGLNPGSLSAIITGGQRPGLETCKALAKLFRVSTVLMLQMAGHIENMPSDHLVLRDPDFHAFIETWQLLSELADMGDEAGRNAKSALRLQAQAYKNLAEERLKRKKAED